MSIIEQLARYLAPRLGMTFEEDVFFGYLPPAPAKAVCVYAGEIRPDGDREGCRVRVAVRSARDGAWRGADPATRPLRRRPGGHPPRRPRPLP